MDADFIVASIMEWIGGQLGQDIPLEATQRTLTCEKLVECWVYCWV